jgi:DNA sulfur modification protein DndD
MYLSRLHLRNWRVYSEATFDFNRPTKKRPITLIGAMNGHGKTSFLMALYLGLFGKYGLRHCEGFRHKANDSKKDSALETMRGAMTQFRRIGASSEEPTEVELVFSPAWQGEDFRELRVLRRWYFGPGNKPKQGDSFETLEIHVADDRYPDGRPLAFDDMEDAHQKLERRLFPAHLTPAFLFDGEQAAELIESMGDGGLRKAVEVMFGTTLLQETVDRLQAFITRTSQKGSSKRKATELEEERDILERENAESNRVRGKLQQQREELTANMDDRVRQREEIKRQLAASGGVSGGSPEALQALVEHAEHEFSIKRRSLAENLSSAGLALAASRFSDVILLQLDKEHLREEWEKVRDATLTRKDAVLDIAMPEPPERDPLTGNLSSIVRDQLKQRFILAIDAIYNPPDPQMAKNYMLGHVKGDEARERLREHIANANNGLAADLKRYAREYRDAASALEDANDRLSLAKNRPSEQSRLLAELETLNQEVQSAERRHGELTSQINATKSEMEKRNKRLGEIREKLKDMGPDQMRAAIADRTRKIFETFADRLRETSAKRLEDVVTEIFTSIADRKFRDSRVRLEPGQPPMLQLANGTELHLSGGSGFERRTFSIAFCLALARITGRRIPLVIDTPVGNAASDYRHRTLGVLAEFDTDQIIILTHDEEVRLPFLEAIEGRVGQKFLIEFDHGKNLSEVQPNKFFTFAQ